MGITLYNAIGSPPCHAVRLAAKHLGVELEIKNMDLRAGEQLKPEFLKMNPQHTVPVLDDGGFYLSESHAILTYLANAYGKDDSLYPTDPKARYLVDQRLAFNLGTLYLRFTNIIFPMVFEKAPVNKANVEKLNEALGITNVYLEQTSYIAGDQLTIADFAVIISLACMDSIKYDISAYPAVVKYMKKLQKELLGYDELVKTLADGFAEWVNKEITISWE